MRFATLLKISNKLVRLHLILMQYCKEHILHFYLYIFPTSSNRIRLGEYDINTEIDCIGQDCNNKVLELGFEEVIPYPEYDPTNQNRHHDIALIRLSQDVDYNDFIRPVCLPLPQSKQEIRSGALLTVAGWGRTLLGNYILKFI